MANRTMKNRGRGRGRSRGSGRGSGRGRGTRGKNKTVKRVGGGRVKRFFKSGVDVPRDTEGTRRLLQAVALRLGFTPTQIKEIMGFSEKGAIPKTIRNNPVLKEELMKLGKIVSKPGSNCALEDIQLDTNGPEFVGNVGDMFSRNVGPNRQKKRENYKRKKALEEFKEANNMPR